MKTLIFHRDGFFFKRVGTPWILVQKNIPLLSHLEVPLVLEGYFEQKVMVFEARKPSKDGMEDGFFLLAIARRSSME
jgi:hypothetical protein